MFTPPFCYRAPRELGELLAVLDEYGPEAKILTGGQSLLPLLKLRLVRPAVVLDANWLPGHDQIIEQPEQLSVGALVRHHQLASDPAIRAHHPWLAGVVPHIGDPQVRSRGTLAGTLVEADPSGDWSAAMLVLDAELLAVSSRGRRVIPIADWFSYSFTPALADDEFVEAVRIGTSSAPSAGAYAKIEKRAGDFAVAGCAVTVRQVAGAPAVTGVGLTGLGYVPLRCPDAALALSRGLQAGGPLPPDSLAEAIEHVQLAIDPIADARGSIDYKRMMASVVLRRAAEAAVASLRSLVDPSDSPPREAHPGDAERRPT